MRLSHGDYEQLLQIIWELHELDSTPVFRAEAPKILLKLLTADYVQFSDFEMDLPRKSAKLVDYYESEPRVTAETTRLVEQNTYAHPFTQYCLMGGRPTAFKQTDFLPLSHFHKTVWGQVLAQQMGIERMISLPLMVGKGNIPSLNFARRARRDFDEHDRLMLNLLRPHFDQACRALRETEALLDDDAKPLTAYALSAREQEVAHWLAEGKSNPEIGIILGASARTVDKHVENILRKTGVENRTSAAMLVSQSLKFERYRGLRAAPGNRL